MSAPTHCRIRVVLNGVTLYDKPNEFPNVPNGDNGEGGQPRYWGRIRIPIPISALREGTNTLVVRNLTAWNGNIGVPYTLISTATLTVAN